MAIRALERAKDDRAAKLRKQLAQIESERTWLVEAIRLGGGGLESLVSAVADCEKRLVAQRDELTQLPATPARDQLSDKRFERDLTPLMGRWREVMAEDVEGARLALRTLIPTDSPIVVEPEASGGLRLRGETRLGALFDASAAPLALAAQRWRPHGEPPHLRSGWAVEIPFGVPPSFLANLLSLRVPLSATAYLLATSSRARTFSHESSGSTPGSNHVRFV
jgi:hypothetical protein